VEAADQRKAIDLRVLDLRSVCDFTDFFVIASGSSQRQVQAISTAIEESLGAAGVKAHHVEGAAQGRWVLLDYGDFVAHVFDEDRRGYYRLEGIWSDAPDVTEAYLRAPTPARP
jgi:ribosome-associated protein